MDADAHFHLVITYLQQGTGRTAVSTAETWAARLPISTYLGWITVATVAYVTTLLDYLNWDRFGITPEIWMGIMLAAMSAIAALMNITRRDVAYALVILWGWSGFRSSAPLSQPWLSTPGLPFGWWR